MAPQCIDDVQSETVLICTFGAFPTTGELKVQAVECGMQPLLKECELEGVCHLLCRFAASTCVGHRQRQGDAVGRVEQVAILCAESLIEVKGKSTVSSDEIPHF